MADVAHLGVKITVSNKEFQKRLTEIQSDVDGMVGGFGVAGTTLAKALGVFSGGAVAAGLTNLIKESLRYADVLDNLSARTGLTFSGLQKLESIGVSAGVSMETLARAVTMLHKNLDSPKAIAQIEQMGLNYAEIRALGPEHQFMAIARALASIDDPIARANAGTALFGRTWDTVAGAFEQDVDSILKNMNEMSDAQVRALAAAGDAWDQWTTNTGRAVKGFLGDVVLVQQGATDLEKSLGIFGHLIAAARGAKDSVMGPLPSVGGSGFLKPPGDVLDTDFAKVIKESDALIAEQNKKRLEMEKAATALRIKLILEEQAMRQLAWNQRAAQLDFLGLREMEAAAAEFARVQKEEADFLALTEANALAHRTMMNEIGVENMNAEAERMAAAGRQTTLVSETMATISQSISQNLAAAMLGTQTFGQAFSNVWQTIKMTVTNILADLLNKFIHNFLSGMLNSIMGKQGAFTSAFGGMFSGFGSTLNGMGKMLGGWLSSAAKAIAAVFSGGGGAGKAISQISGTASSSLGGAAGAAGLGGVTLATGLATAGIGAAAIGAYVGVKKLIGQSKKKEVNKASDAFFAKNGGLEGVNQAAEAAGDTDFQTTQAIFNAKDKGQFDAAVKQWEQVTGKGGSGIMAKEGPFYWNQMAAGGIVTRPTMAMIGEAGPEAVIPLDRAGMGGDIHITIHAVDAASFEDLVRRRGVKVFMQAVKHNTDGSRSFLREALA